MTPRVFDTVKWFDQNSTIRSAKGASVLAMCCVRATIAGMKLARPASAVAAFAASAPFRRAA